MRYLERAPLTRHEPFFELVAPWPAALAQAVMLHVSANRGVAGQLAERRVLPPNHQQIVVDQLVTPARMIAAQPPNLLRHSLRDTRMQARMFRHLALQRADRILGAAYRIEPALDGFGAKAHHLVRAGVPPRLRRQLGDTRGKLSRFWRRGQELANDLKTQSCPTHARRRTRLVAHGYR